MVDPSIVDGEDVGRINALLSEAMLRNVTDVQAMVCGVVVISDSVGGTMGHMKQFSPALGKKMITIFEEAYPNRPKELHMLNMPSIFETLFNIMKGFMKEKMRERLIVHPKGDLTALQESVGLEILPEEYGGTNGKIQDHVDLFNKHVYDSKKWLMQQEKFKSNEKKRTGFKKTYSEVFGMEGSFRQLAFDWFLRFDLNT